MSEYPHREPHPIVSMIRLVWLVVLGASILVGISILVGMLGAGWWWIGPIVVLYAFCVVVLLRKRTSRLRGPS